MNIVYDNKPDSDDNLKEKLRSEHFHFHQQNYHVQRTMHLWCVMLVCELQEATSSIFYKYSQ
jgi:hypothetical protein